MNASAARQKLHTRLSAAELRSRWQRMLRDPMLADVPGKLELNEKGTIELTPPNTRHSILSRHTMGDECARPGIGVFQAMWVVGDQVVGSAGSVDTPAPSVPRHCAQRAVSVWPFAATVVTVVSLVTATIATITTNPTTPTNATTPTNGVATTSARLPNRVHFMVSPV
jgi:hypothetical protein